MTEISKKIKSYSCSYCLKPLKSSKSVGSHSKWCKLGPHRINTLAQNKNNLNRIDNSFQDIEKEVKCKYCEKVFASVRKCNGHKSSCSMNPNKADRSAQPRMKTHTPESRKKISESRKLMLASNPHLNIQHYGPSKPENYLIKKLIEWDFNIIPQYSDSRWMRGFKIDIYLPDHNTGLEVNGQFKYKDGKIKSYYQKRSNIILETSGIKIIDIHYAKVYSLTKDDILEYINESSREIRIQ